MMARCSTVAGNAGRGLGGIRRSRQCGSPDAALVDPAGGVCRNGDGGRGERRQPPQAMRGFIVGFLGSDGRSWRARRSASVSYAAEVAALRLTAASRSPACRPGSRDSLRTRVGVDAVVLHEGLVETEVVPAADVPASVAEETHRDTLGDRHGDADGQRLMPHYRWNRCCRDRRRARWADRRVPWAGVGVGVDAARIGVVPARIQAHGRCGGRKRGAAARLRCLSRSHHWPPNAQFGPPSRGSVRAGAVLLVLHVDRWQLRVIPGRVDAHGQPSAPAATPLQRRAGGVVGLAADLRVVGI